MSLWKTTDSRHKGDKIDRFGRTTLRMARLKLTWPASLPIQRNIQKHVDIIRLDIYWTQA